MANSEQPSRNTEPRVVSFRRPGRPVAARQPAPSPVDDLAKYEHSDGADDYRHRMLINLAALVFVAALIAAGLWIADTMAALRKNQDCILAGHPNCTPLDRNRR